MVSGAGESYRVAEGCGEAVISIWHYYHLEARSSSDLENLARELVSMTRLGIDPRAKASSVERRDELRW